MITAEGLRKRYGDKTALDGVNLTVAAGTVCGLLGPNGAGKTTAVRILTTLLRADGGRAEVAGHDVAREPDRVRASIGLVGQHAAVDEALSGRQNLELFGRLYHLSKAAARTRAGELLDQFNLADTGTLALARFSGGMRRRLDLAASLILAPRVLFLDEPTTGLDPRGRNEVWAVVRALVAEGTTVLLTTQYLDEADQLADRISVVDRGRVIAEGTPTELKSSLGGDRLDVVLRDVADLDRAAAVLERVTGAVPETDPDTRRVSAPVRDRVSALTEAAHALRDGMAAEDAVEDIALRRPTLDEVFLHLTGHATEEEGGDARMTSRPNQPERSSTAPQGNVTQTSHKHVTKQNPPSPKRNHTFEFRGGGTDGWMITRRDLLHWVRQPAPVVVGLLFPVMLVLIFGYLFGGAMTVPGGGDYKEFLLPGMFAMTMAFGLEATMVAISTDVRRGVTDRFRSMPMAPSAVVVGRCGADLLNSAAGLAVMIASGLLVGWQTRGSVGATLAAVGLLLLLRFALLWVGIYLGLVVRNPEAVMAVQILIWPVGFLANTFAAPGTMPGWLGTIAEWNPLSSTVAAARELFGNPGWGGDSWIAQHATLMAVVWPLVLVAIFFPLSVRRYQRLGR